MLKGESLSERTPSGRSDKTEGRGKVAREERGGRREERREMTCLKEEEWGERERRRSKLSPGEKKNKEAEREGGPWRVVEGPGKGRTVSPLPVCELCFCRRPRWAGHPLRILTHFEYSGKIWLIFRLKSHGWFYISSFLQSWNLSVPCMHEGMTCTKCTM